MGFCYLNNLAIAVAAAQAASPGLKAAVLDIDCHHGNGSEDIFLGRKNTLFISLHQVPLYPGTGRASRDNVINFPLPPLTGGKAYLDAFEKACEAAAAFGPELIGVSAGFDTFRGDPLTRLALDIPDYGELGRRIHDLGLPVFSVLEGGYHPQLGECVLAFLRGLESRDAAADPAPG